MTLLLMQATDKERLGVYLSPSVDKKLRIFSVNHQVKNLSEIVEAALLHCLDNKAFINKISLKKEEEIPY